MTKAKPVRHDRTSTEELAEYKLYISRIVLISASIFIVGVALIVSGYTTVLVLDHYPGIVPKIGTQVSELLRSENTPTQLLPQVIRGATYTYYPTYTPYPISASAIEPRWIWLELNHYGLKVEIPSNWSLFPINSRHEPDKLDQSYSDVCEDYLLIGPDGKQVITLMFTCEFGEGVPMECSSLTTLIPLEENKYIYRVPREEDNSFIYGSARYADLNGSEPGGPDYICYSEYPTKVRYQYIGRAWDDIDDFITIDRIALSLYQP